MSIEISKKLLVELTKNLQENATDFFHKKELIGYLVSYEDLLSEPEFEKFRPFNKKTSSDKMFQTFIEFVIKKIQNLPTIEQKSLIYKIVEQNTQVIINEKFSVEVRKTLNGNTNNLLSKIEKVVLEYKNIEGSENNIKNIQNEITESVLKTLNDKTNVNNLIFETVDYLINVRKNIK